MARMAPGDSPSRVRALLDASVLYPAALRDTLLRAAEAHLYAPAWSDTIVDEFVRNLVADGRIAEPGAKRLRDALRTAFPNALVAGHEHLIAAMTNHPKDRHVLAAAVHIGAKVIVTSNLRDFREQALAPHGISAQSPDDFLCALLDSFPVEMLEVIVEQAAALKKSPKTPADVLSAVGIVAPTFAARAQRLLGSLAGECSRRFDSRCRMVGCGTKLPGVKPRPACRRR